MEILVTGGTGFLGQHLVKRLLADGHQVRVLGRDFAAAEALLAAGVSPIQADLRDRAVVAAACKGVEAVFHVGALSAPWGRSRDFYDINLGGTEAIVSGCLAYGARRLIYVSSPSVVFDGNETRNQTEAAPYPRRFTSVYSLTKKLGEDRVNAVADKLETVILRPKAIFGPGDRALLPRMIAAAKQGRLPQIGAGRNRVDLTYVENVAHALVLALEAPAAAGKTYTITNDEHPLLWEVICQVLERLGLPTHLRQVPLRGALAAAWLMERRAALTGKEPLLTRYSATILARTQTYDISAAQRDIGYRPLVSLDDGIERTLEALRAEACIHPPSP